MDAMERLAQANEILENYPDECDFSGGATIDDIRAAETALGLTFPESYRRFLSTLGAGSFAGAEFYGVIKGKPIGTSVPSVAWANLDLRKRPNFPNHLITTYNNGDGSLLCIDTSQMDSEKESPAILWTFDLEQPYLKEYDSFGHLFLDIVRQEILFMS